MNYNILADIITIVHTLLIVGILMGILISARYKKFRPIESFALLGAIVIWSLYSGCPLTYLEDYLRTLGGNPIPLTQIGFISFYLDKWFSVSITDKQLVTTTYITAIVFFGISVEWISAYINPEIIKLRKTLGWK